MDDRENTPIRNEQHQGDASNRLSSVRIQRTSEPEQLQSGQINDNINANPHKTKRWFRNPDWHMVWLTALLFLVAFITALIFYRQFSEMQTQTRILNDQAMQAASDSIEASKKVERQLAISQQQATATANSVATLQKQFRLDQRPLIWVASPDQIQGKPNPALRTIEDKGGKGIAVNVYYFNYGKSPAINLVERRDIQIGPNAINKIELKRIPKDTFLPNGVSDFVTLLAGPLTDQQITEVLNTDMGVTIATRFRYRDSLNHWYQSDVCLTRLKSGSWAICEPNGIRDCSEEHCDE